MNILSRQREFFIDKPFWLLLIYSLLPGVSKILDIQLILLGAIPIVLFLVFSRRDKIVLSKFDYLFIFFVGYLFIQTLLYLTILPSNKLGVCMAIFLNILPMLGYIFSKELSFEYFCDIIVKIIFVHCIIAILLYPPFMIVPPTDPIVESLTEGVAFGRMASVSGSLGFGNMIMTGLIIAIFKKKKYIPLFTFCWIFCGQRSAWLGVIFGTSIMLLFSLKSGKVLITLKYVFLILIMAFILGIVIVSVLQIDLDFIVGRLSEFEEATSERDEQWINGWNNFRSVPIGVGPGQVGQIASRYENAELTGIRVVPDGDYFRVLSEYGFGGMIYYIGVLSFFLMLIFLKIKTFNYRVIIAIIGGDVIQMIGSNISEFYFTNFIYWMMIGYFFHVINSTFKMKLSRYDKRLHSYI